MASKYVPLISSGTPGPAGVLHLPRLWQKVLLHSTGALAEGYDGCGSGYDQMVLDALGLDRNEVIQFISQNKPTYIKFEQWALGKKGGKFDSSKVSQLNDAIRGYNHADATRKSILEGAGVQDTGSIKDAVNLNNIDDWNEFHKSLGA